MKIKVIKLRDPARLPQTATSGSAGADIYACVDGEITVAPGERAMIYTGIAVEIPKGYGGFMFPRSSLAVKYGVSLPNCVGVIDSDYRGELCVPVINHGSEPYTVRNGDRIAQMIILETPAVEYELAEELSDTERGSGGFGSTGK